MKVKDVIAILQTMNPESEVVICDDNVEWGTYSPVSFVEKRKMVIQHSGYHQGDVMMEEKCKLYSSPIKEKTYRVVIG